VAQVRAQRRHLDRLRIAARRDAAHEQAADADAEREADAGIDPDTVATPSISSAEARLLLIAEQAALELDRAGLVADRDVDGVEMDL
jgi:hypothetical protein